MQIIIKRPSFEAENKGFLKKIQVIYYMKRYKARLYQGLCVRWRSWLSNQHKEHLDWISKQNSCRINDSENKGTIHSSSILHVVLKKPTSNGTTTTHFIKSMNELLDIMDFDENLKSIYIVIDYVLIHKSHPTIRNTERKGYHEMYLPP